MKRTKEKQIKKKPWRKRIGNRELTPFYSKITTQWVAWNSETAKNSEPNMKWYNLPDFFTGSHA